MGQPSHLGRTMMVSSTSGGYDLGGWVRPGPLGHKKDNDILTQKKVT